MMDKIVPNSSASKSRIDPKTIEVPESKTTEPEVAASSEAASTLTTLPPDVEVIATLAAMPPLEYERVRVEFAVQLGCRTHVLDKLVKEERERDDASDSLPFPVVDPFPEPIEPAFVLNKLSATIHRFVVMDEEQVVAVTLWTALTWFIDVVEVAALLLANSPERGCGKTVLLELLARLSARPLPVSNVTTASLFRSVELWQPTLVIDEADTFVRENDEFKGLINAGHTRPTAFVLRVVGDSHEPKLFPVWGAKALAGISLEKHLPEATRSRAIVIHLRRKLPHEKVERLRHAEPGSFEELASKLARFRDDYAPQVRRARPALPESLSDRAQDNWEPLLAIAGCAGPEWVRRATAAALKLSGDAAEPVSTGNELLADIKQVFVSKQIDKIRTADLIAELAADEEQGWATYNRGKSITARQLARLLDGYGIKSKTVRFGGSTPKGYDLSQFADAFARYLVHPEKLPQRRNDTPETNRGVAGGVADSDRVAATRSPAATPGPMTELDCGGVADTPGEDDHASAGHGLHPLNLDELF